MSFKSLQSLRAPLLGLGILSFFVPSVFAEIYKYEDAEGRTIFSDQILQGLKRLDSNLPQPIQNIENKNSHAPKPFSLSPNLEPKSAEIPKKINYNIKISSPQNKSIIPLGITSLLVSAEIEPSISESTYKVEFFLDGNLHSSIENGNSSEIKHLFRGVHTLQTKLWLLPKSGSDYEFEAESPLVEIHQMRPKN
ncbi:MAG: DUF4124 domain-containing protein [Gammaproteobacteria bacterium]